LFSGLSRNRHSRVTHARHTAGVAQRKILSVEDEPDLAEVIRYNLEQHGFAVRTAGTGLAALERVREERPDLILLDLMLPDLDGFGVCEILRADPATATIPIIIVSAWSTNDSRNLGLELGALDYIAKPFSPAQLLERVNRYVGVPAAG
jgi:DNA-binding response OmpR family regulator